MKIPIGVIFLVAIVFGGALLLISKKNGIISSDASNITENSVTKNQVITIETDLPPMPDEIINKSTIKGVDSNNNGIRDDVEIIISKEFGSDPELYKIANKSATILQALLVNEELADKVSALSEVMSKPGDKFNEYLAAKKAIEEQKEHADYINFISCLETDEELDISQTVTEVMLDTPERRGVYGSTLAGASFGECSD